MPRTVKSARVNGRIAYAHRRPFRKGSTAGAGGVAAVLGKGAVVEDDVVRQHSARATVLLLAVAAVDNIPEPLQPLGSANLIGVCLRAAAGGKRGVAGNPAAKCTAGDGSVVDDLAVECAAFDGAAGGNGHFAIEHSPAGACNGTGTVVFIFISQHDVAVNRAAVGVKFPIDIRRRQRAGDV